MALTLSHAVGPTSPPLRDITLGALLAWAAETTPDRIALIEGTPDPATRQQWTYAQLYAESQRTARALRTRFQPGERVAVWSANRPEWVMLEFGCALAGLVLVTVNPAFRAQEVQYVLNQSKSSGAFVADQFRGNPMLATVQQVAPACPTLRDILRLDDWAGFIAAGDDATIALPDVQPRDAVMIQYTSGTTGFPKGALLHHQGLANNGAHTADRMGVADGSVWITTMPLFHTGGCVCCVIGAVSRRCTQVLLEAFEPGLVLELFETYKGNAMVGVPTMLIAMLEETLGAPFTIVFGQTECSPVAQMTRPDDSVQDKAETLGGPMPHVEVKIIDPATGATLPVGQIGEYCTRGYHVMHGYFDMPEATAAAIDADGWLHTGDLCAMDARGYCTVEGRLKDMIIRGGENIYPRELEELLFRHPSVGSVAVVGLPDAKWGEEVAAFLRPAPGAVIQKAELIDYMRQHLAPHKTPRRWFSVAEFPLTGSGKIQKFKLRALQQAGQVPEL